MRNRKNCLAVLLMTTIVVMGCGNQQVKKENPSAVSERASSVQDESEDGEKEFLSTYQNIIITLGIKGRRKGACTPGTASGRGT